MSKGPWLRKKEPVVSPEIISDIEKWKNTPAYKANAETLERLDRVEEKYGLNEDFILRTPCPICKSKEYLVESYSHHKILICERPNCIYERARAKVALPKLTIVVNE